MIFDRMPAPGELLPVYCDPARLLFYPGAVVPVEVNAVVLAWDLLGAEMDGIEFDWPFPLKRKIDMAASVLLLQPDATPLTRLSFESQGLRNIVGPVGPPRYRRAPRTLLQRLRDRLHR